MTRLATVGRVLRIIGLATLCTTSVAHAANAVPSSKTYPPPIKMAIKQGMHVVRSFPAVSGLRGWLLMRDGSYTIVFTTPDQKTMIIGMLTDETGANLTATYGQKFIPKPDYAKLFSDLQSTGYITEGETKHPKSVIYVFFDANCIFCHLTWKALQPYEKVGLQVRWVPVAFLKPTSTGKAAAIMQAKDPAAALGNNESRFNTATEDGGIDPLNQPAKSSIAHIVANGKLMSRFGANGTPLLVWKDKKGAVQTLDGLPKLSNLPRITGLPEQVINDPALARFK